MRPTIHAKVLATLIGCCLIWSLAGCAGPKQAEKQPEGEKVKVPPAVQQAPPAPPPPKAPTYFIRTVAWPNESLSIIAAWYTGQIDNWKVLVEANPQLDPNRMRIGDKVRIPEELLKTREPMPQEFVESLVPKPKPVKKARPPKNRSFRQPGAHHRLLLNPTSSCTDRNSSEQDDLRQTLISRVGAVDFEGELCLSVALADTAERKKPVCQICS